MSLPALLAAADPATLDDLLRLAAAADARVTVARTAEAARSGWARAPLVLVDTGLAAELAREGPPPRRQGVVLLTRTGEDQSVYRLAVELGAQDVAVLADAENHLVAAMASAGEPTDERALLVGVLGGRGGAGASALAAMLAITAAGAGVRTLLLDGDPLGGGLDLALGGERLPGIRWPELAGLRGRISGTALAEGLPRLSGGGPWLLPWGREPSAPVSGPVMTSVLAAALRGFEFVVADLPRCTASSDSTRAALAVADLVLLVVPTEVRAVVAARHLAATLRADTGDIRVVVRRTPRGALRAESVAAALDLPLAGEMAADRSVPGALDRGDLHRLGRRGPLRTLCGSLVDSLWPPGCGGPRGAGAPGGRDRPGEPGGPEEVAGW